MAGRFEGMSDAAWMMIEKLLPPEPEKRGRGMPHAPFRCVLNSILYVLITGARWCDLPIDRTRFAPKSSSHRWLVVWQKDGTLKKIERGMIALADLSGQIDWRRSSVDGSFSPRAGRRRSG
jgi:transposase